MLRDLLLLCGLGATLVFTCSSMGWCVPEISTGPAQSGLRIGSVEFEPVGSDKNVVHVRVVNPTAEQKSCVIDVQTQSREHWDRQYFMVVKAGETRDVRCVFFFIGPVDKDASVTLKFYESASANSYDDSQFFQQQRFSLSDLPVKTPEALNILPESDRKAAQVREAFTSFQQLIRRQKYGKAWDAVFSPDYRDAFQSLDNFKLAMTGDLPISTVYWDRDTLLGMHPASVGSANHLIVLSVTNSQETWHINFTPAENGWQIDWIGGYAPAILQIPGEDDLLRLLLAKTQAFSTQHFEIHYYQHSTAERELNSLAQDRERAYAKIVEFLGATGSPGDKKILLFLFEDQKTKFLDTGTIGLGFANGVNTIGEVYNKKQHCDPYHEPTHILMGPYGDPPAILNEGVATYMSERLGGASSLRYLGGRTRALYGRVRDLKQKGEWISLQELFTYTDIGSQGNRTVLAYVEVGAFVKYLIETYGKEKFLEAFKKLISSEDPEIRRQNQLELERIYGAPLQKLEGDWERSFMSKRR